MGLSFVDQRYSTLFKGKGDSGSFTIIQRIDGQSCDERLEMIKPPCTEAIDLDHSICREPLGNICIARLAAGGRRIRLGWAAVTLG
jgi:hypothetical protein